MIGMIRVEDILPKIKPAVQRWIREATGRPARDGRPAGHVVRVISTATQTVNNATVTPLAFDTEIYDTHGGWSAGNPTRLVATRTGWHSAGGTWGLGSSQNTAASRMLAIIRVNGTTTVQSSELHSIAGKSAYVPVVEVDGLWLNTGDYIELCAYHDQGSAKTASGATSSAQNTCSAWLTAR